MMRFHQTLSLVHPAVLSLAACALFAAAGCSPESRHFGEGGATASSAASTGAGTGGDGGAGGSGGTSTPSEDCTNGIDDDGDGKRDCDDEDCTEGYTCVAAAPDGWSGPVAVSGGDPAGGLACAAPFPNEAYRGYIDLVADPAVCEACACDAGTATPQCNLATLQSFSLPGCLSGTKNFQQNPTGCTQVPTGNQVAAFKASPPVASAQGACAPSGGQVILAPPAWKTVDLACASPAVGKGCGDQVCAPRGKPPFEEMLCVWKAGDQACPDPYSAKRLLEDDPMDVTDTRGCSSCTCSKPAATCTATTTVYSNPVCGGAIVDVPNTGSCVGSPGPLPESLSVKITKSVSCNASGGAPQGTLTPAGLKTTTVCCLP